MRRLLLLPLVLFAVGCGAEQVDVVDADDVAAKTGASSARIDMDMRVEASEEDLSAKDREELSYLNFAASGAIAEHGRLFRLAYIYPAKTLGLEGQGDVTFDAILDSETGDVYVKYSPEIGIELPQGKQWVHMQDEELQGLGQSPSEMVDYLYAAGELERVGEERIRGVPTVEYAARIDLERAAEELGEQMGDSAKESLETLKDAGVDEIPMNVWIDDEGYLRRLVMNWRVPEEIGAPADTRLELRMELWDFGADLGVKVPAKSTVIEEEELE